MGTFSVLGTNWAKQTKGESGTDLALRTPVLQNNVEHFWNTTHVPGTVLYVSTDRSAAR